MVLGVGVRVGAKSRRGEQWRGWKDFDRDTHRASPRAVPARGRGEDARDPGASERTVKHMAGERKGGRQGVGVCAPLLARGGCRPAGPGCPLPLWGSRRISMSSELSPEAGRRRPAWSPAQRGVSRPAAWALRLAPRRPELQPGALRPSVLRGVLASASAGMQASGPPAFLGVRLSLFP